jgi:formamidopyrimidine-DNA glycosylase
MPELPDVTLYIEALAKRIHGQPLLHVRFASPFLLRTALPPIGTALGRRVRRLRRLGKRIAIGLEDELWLVLHLMINGRLHWKEAGAKLGGRHALAAFDFPNGTLTLTEFGPKKRASRARAIRSSARSPIRACSAASATPIPTRSCIGRACRRWP